MWIEVFKTGLHTSSNGKSINYTNEDLLKIATNYNQRIQLEPTSKAPLVKGHPESNAPAYGWIDQLARRGDFLLAKVKDLTNDIINDIKDKKFQKVSISLTNDLNLRHIGLLGAAAPAVEGLKPIEFTMNLDNFEILSDIELNNESTANQETENNSYNYSELIDENTFMKNQIRDYQKVIQQKDFEEFTANLIKNNCISQNYSKPTMDLLELCSQIDEVTNNKFDTLNKAKAYLNKLTSSNLKTEFAKPTDALNFDKTEYSLAMGNNREKLHNQITRIMNENENLTYEQALKSILQ
jgi:hypothetical protein